MDKIPVIVLGATGSVGQRFVQLLEDHPWFQVTGLTGSDRSIGKTYAEACHWLLPEKMPEAVRRLPVLPTDPGSIGEARLAFSALPADLARSAEADFARAGLAVCSNASSYRRDALVPVLLPEVNPGHLAVLPAQRQQHGWTGCIVTNPNCTSTGMTVVLKALADSFGLVSCFAVSLQALSGAGYPGVAAMDILDNVIPTIPGEEEKVEWEPRKMLGAVGAAGIEPSSLVISAHTNRVAVTDAHTVCLSVALGRQAEPQEAVDALASYQAPPDSRDLPSAPQPPIQVRLEADRPQPRLDRGAGQGMTTVVGRVRRDAILDLKMTVLSHNTIRGAAGGSIYNAELLLRTGQIA